MLRLGAWFEGTARIALHVELQKLNPRVVWLWRFQGLVRVLMFWAPVSMGVGIGLSQVMPGFLAGVLAAGFWFLQLMLALLWPGLAYRYFGYLIREQDLLVQRGVLFRRRTSIPHNRIQHVDTRQGPFEQLLGLSRVLVFTASGMAADGSLPGVGHELAETIRDDLSARGGDDGV